MAVTQMIGAKIHRREDPRLVSGHGRYVDDHNRPGQVYATFVRSPYAHAQITKIELTDAAAVKGVVAVYTAKDFQGQLAGTHPRDDVRGNGNAVASPQHGSAGAPAEAAAKSRR